MAEVEPMKIDGADEMKLNVDAPDQKKKPLKRKRMDANLFPATPVEKQEKINELRNEISSLIKFCKELVLENREAILENVRKAGHSSASSNTLIACLMEESDLPLSKLVDEIFQKVKGRTGNGQSVTLATVKSTVLMVGHRLCYGVTNADADVLEDETECALWCWETRDLKLIPKLERLSVKVRRTCRKKIQERITAVLAMISALGKSENHKNCLQEMIKASEKLGKVLSEVDIRVLLQNISQKNGAEMAEKEVMKGEKQLIKQMEKSKREMEKERKKMDRELQKEKLQSEKELKRLHDEAEKEEKRREKEEYEIQKQLKKQQEEAENVQKRKEKEEAELRKQLALQKQASVMERFLKRNITTSTPDRETSTKKPAILKLSSNVVERKSESVTQAMDSVLAQTCGIVAEAIWKLHLNSWRSIGCSTRSDRKVHWGVRQKPKAELVKEIKLTTNKELTCDEDSNIEKLVDGWVGPSSDKSLSHTYTDRPLPNGHKRIKSKQLLQFDKSHRPAFYGVWPRKSQVVRPRNPFAKDPEVDYEIDSDDEWEEEEPGESLSDCDKDEEDENVEANLKGDDEDESEDGFFVPDGYLSENEGAQADDMESDELFEEVKDMPDSGDLVQSEEFCTLLRQQKYLSNLTEHALKKNQPLIIVNLMHENTTSLPAEELTGIAKLERMCLQTLCIHSLPGFTSIEILNHDNVVDDGKEASSTKSSTTPIATAPALLDSDLSQIVSIIQSCPHSIGKIVESLHTIFSTISKSQLKNKVREISEFSSSDNRWQVKKEILSKLGLSISPEKNSKPKTITTFFSKRCPAPHAKNMN